MRLGPRLQLPCWPIYCQLTGYPVLLKLGRKEVQARILALVFWGSRWSVVGRLVPPDLCGPSTGAATVPMPLPRPSPFPMATSRGSHPVNCELANDDSRTEGASWVHGAAREVDLGSKREFRCEEDQDGPGKGQSPLPYLRALVPASSPQHSIPGAWGPSPSPKARGAQGKTLPGPQSPCILPRGDQCVRVHGVPSVPHPNEVAQCHRDPNHGGRGAGCLTTVGGS